MINLNNLIHKYDDKTILQIDSLNIKDNSIVGLTGVNGCGKSTLLRILAGIYKPTNGDVLVDNLVLYENEEIKKDMLLISDDPFSDITIKEIKTFYSLFYNMDISLFEEFLIKFDISKDGNLAKFSKGMRRRVYLAVALAISPKLLLLDEAFDGLDPIAKQLFKQEIIKQIDEKDMIVIISSHSLKDIEDLADEFILLKDGKIILSQETSNSITKISVCFNEEHNISQFNHSKIIDIKGNKKIFTFIVEDEEVLNYLKTFNPIIIETDELSFEEIFFYKNKGAKK